MTSGETERKCSRCGVTIAEVDKAHPELCCLCYGNNFRVEIKGRDFSVELEDGNRLSVDVVIDRWPPHQLGLRVLRPGRSDITATYALVTRGETEWVKLADVQPAMEKAEAVLKEEIRRLEEEVSKMRTSITAYVDRPGCNPGSRKLATRRLLWAAGVKHPND